MQNKLDNSTPKAIYLFLILFLLSGGLLTGSVALLYRMEINTLFIFPK